MRAWHYYRVGTLEQSAANRSAESKDATAKFVTESAEGDAGARAGRTHWVFAVLATVAIAAFLSAIPAGFGLDEQGHANRSWQLSQATLLPVENPEGPGFGGEIPDAWNQFQMLGWYWSNVADRSVPLSERADFQERDLYSQLGSSTLAGPQSFQQFTNTGVTSPAAYAPAALGIAVARALNLDVHSTYQVGRAANGAMYVALGFAAIWLLRRSRLRWFFLAAALLPTAIFQAAVYTADTYTNAVALLFTACVIRLLLERRTAEPPVGLVTVAILSGIGLALAKPSYAPIAATFLLLPSTLLGGRRLALLVKALFIVFLGVIVAGWTAITSDIVDALYLQTPWPDEIDPNAQLEGLVSDPVALPSVIATSLADFGWLWWTELPAQFGYNNVKLPFPWWLLVYLSLVLVAYAGPKLRRLHALVFLAIGIATSTAVIMSIYLTFNPVGAATTIGVHPRYFFPLLLIVIPALTSLLPGRLNLSARSMGVAVPLLASSWLAVSMAVWLYSLY